MVMSAASARSPRRANTAVTSSSTNSSGAALSLLAALTSLHVIVLHVCILLPTASALCGFDARQVVAINATLAVAICSPRVARIFRIPPSSCCSSRGTSAASRLRKRSSLIVQPGYADACCDVAFTVTATSNETTIDTGYLRIVVPHSDDDMAISFYSSLSGNLVTSETASSFTAMPNTTHTRMANSQSWTLSDDEALYGGGQYVNGHINYAAASLLMVQSNTEAVVPFFLSSSMVYSGITTASPSSIHPHHRHHRRRSKLFWTVELRFGHHRPPGTTGSTFRHVRMKPTLVLRVRASLSTSMTSWSVNIVLPTCPARLAAKYGEF
mmetsp:Transcript_37179/g.81507  ORF Transcript_37179/g.81507 Transcript_37179/m.81507 type:complete len:326 (+) Transcript_37179:74-1051(+)